jgi:hypothetical protein
MQYETTINLSGDSLRALDHAVRTLTARGMKLTTRTSASVELAGEGGWPNSKDDPLKPVSRVTLGATGSSLSIRADLDGISQLLVLVTVLSAAADIPAAFLVWQAMWKQNRLLAIVLAMLVGLSWLIVVPLLRWILRRRTSRAIDEVIARAAARQEPAESSAPVTAGQ